jgi:hypothetical protein
MNLLADDVLFLDKDDGVVNVYAFPEDIGVRKGTVEMLGHFEFIQAVSNDERQKRFVDVQHFFKGQYTSSCPVRLMVFLNKKQRGEEFRAEPLSPAQAVSSLMQEYISQEQAKEGEADFMFNIFSDMAAQAPAYRLFLCQDTQVNAEEVRALLEKHLM